MARLEKLSERADDRTRMAFMRSLGTRLIVDTFTWDVPNLPSNTVVNTTLTTSTTPAVEGLRAGMPIMVNPPSSFSSELLWGAYVGADDTLTIRIRNHTGSPINPASGVWSYFGVIP